MKRTRSFLTSLVLVAAVGCAPTAESPGEMSTVEPRQIRIALFNIRELRTEKLLDLDERGKGQHPQVVAAARIIRKIDPDILILNEIDHDYESAPDDLALNARRFRDTYLSAEQEVSDLRYAFAAPNNTGLLSGVDLDGDGTVASDDDRGSRIHGNDSFGYGTYPGEYSMAVLSRYPLAGDRVRSFQKLLWKDLPGHHIPVGHFSDEALGVFRLSSKSHWDLPVDVEGREFHLLLSHPTPQGFDGDEDKNGRRNFDEIKLWANYIDGNESLTDDQGNGGGFDSRSPFVVAGDLNAAPLNPERDEEGPFRTSIYDGMAAIDQLLRHPRIRDSGSFATSAGALVHRADVPRTPGPPGFPERSTSHFGPGARIDYILPSVDLQILDGGVFWPSPEEDPEGAAWADEASDHRLVWLDLEIGRER